MNNSTDENNSEENKNGISGRTLNLILTILSIIVILFSSGFYLIDRIQEVEKTVELECQLRSRMEKQIDRMDEKIDIILQRLPERKENK